MNRYVIGIDTGGTFTDGVLLHYKTRKVIKTAKTLTTKNDLKLGVIRALQMLEITDDYDIRLVGISSTLATNSIAEGKARKVGLLLIGYDKDLVDEYGLLEKVSAENVEFFEGGHNAQGIEKVELDELAIRQWVHEKQQDVDAFAISSYFSPLNPDHENRTFKIIQEESTLPVVMAHQLTTKIGSIKRAATVSLNASLVAVMQEFIEAVNHSLSDMGIKAPLMIVRGDGTLMPCSEAVQKPVETVLSGPAASAIGGLFLSHQNNSLVIDVGSTTTDMALVQNGRVVVSEQGARVGNTHTAVEAGRIRTVSIGCDSRIWLDPYNKIKIGPEKVTPLAQLAMRYNKVAKEFNRLATNERQGKYFNDLEYWGLYNQMEDEVYQNLSAVQKKVIDYITDHPRNLTAIIKKAGVYHKAHLNMDDLITQGYIECSSLTPSDLFHAEGSINIWDADTAHKALNIACAISGITRKKFIENTVDSIVALLVEEIVIYLACQDSRTNDMPVRIDGEWGRWMLKEILFEKNSFLGINLDSKVTIIGTGAPAELFLKRAAAHVDARFVLPENYQVANAVGAVSGSIVEVCEAIVFTRQQGEKYTHIVRIKEEQEHFEEFQDACEYAEQQSKEIAREQVIEAGASDPFVEVIEKTEGSLHRFTARAVGNPKLSAYRKAKAHLDKEVNING
ncbi:MAG: hypothetical protein GVY19_03155 [Bacteroidetes bacterium]|jgi:N-methylhydantoinase A/oxoprolinase/acetone carboxylase beta subunit|nr:hypothetical protein [Bacteroidota bacterium]